MAEDLPLLAEVREGTLLRVLLAVVREAAGARVLLVEVREGTLARDLRTVERVPTAVVRGLNLPLRPGGV